MKQLLVFLLLPAWAFAVSPELAAIKLKVAEQQQKIEALERESLDKLAAGYRAQLDLLDGRFKRAGLVEAVVAARNEKARFAKAGSVEEASLVDEPADLRALQTAVRKQQQKIAARRAILEAKLRDDFRDRLQDLKTSLTRQDRIEEALEAAVLIKELGQGRAVPAGGAGLPAPGLALYLNFDKAFTEEVQGQGPHGLTGVIKAPAAWSPRGRKGGALQLKGGSSAVWITDHPSLNPEKELTVALWIKADRYPEGETDSFPILCKPGLLHRQYLLHLLPHGIIELTTKGQASKWMTRIEAQIPSGRWFHLAWVVDHGKSRMRVFIDGREVEHAPSPFERFRQTGPGDLGIGKREGTNDTFEGFVDEVLIYQRALSDAELQQVLAVTSGGKSVPVLRPLPARKPWPGAVGFRGHHYKAFNIWVPWKKARELCEAIGGKLVSINDEAENTFVRKLPRRYPAWIGLERSREGFRWMDGSALSYKNWSLREPNNVGGAEPYGALYETGSWNDLRDQAQAIRSFICEWE